MINDTKAPTGKNWESWILKKKTDEMQEKNDTIQEIWILEKEKWMPWNLLNQKTNLRMNQWMKM